MELAGMVKRLIFRSDDGAFFIFLLEDSNGKHVKAKGVFAIETPTPGQFVTLEGKWEDTKWGPTFNAASLRVVVPTGTEGLSEYLQSHVKHIGPVLSQRLVDTFGEDTIRVLDEEPERLVEVERLTQRAREELVAAWQAQRNYRKVALDLIRLDLPKRVIKQAYEAWGEAAVERLKANPYALMTLDGVGFLEADRLGLGLGLDPAAPMRVAGVIEYVLEQTSQAEGHLYLTLRELRTQLGGIMRRNKVEGFGRSLSLDDLRTALLDLKNRDRVVLDGKRLYLRTAYHVEKLGAERLVGMLAGPSPLASVDVEAFLETFERVQGITLSDQQRAAVQAASRHPVLLITGGPGTGKTTISRAIVRLFKQADLRIELMSPTGIAAKRLSNVVGHPASTVHRALGYRGDSWTHGPDNPLSADAVLVDEFSMVDQELLYRLLGALKPGTLLVCVGDHAQLPSVGAGNVLHEMIRSGAVPRVNLTEIFRQAATSGIVRGAHRINQGQMPERGHDDFLFVSTDAESVVLDQIKRLIQRIQTTAERGTTFQVLSPRWAGTLGVTNLNKEIREVLNPDKGQKKASVGRGVEWRVGDRVIVVENNYDLGVYNGEQGTVTDIDYKNKEVMVRVRDGHTKVVPFSYKESRTMLKLAFCITIHRSQGQEFDYVILPFVDAYGFQLQRNLFYTAITRAKSRVFLFGHWSAVERAVRDNQVTERNTHFAQRLRELLGA